VFVKVWVYIFGDSYTVGMNRGVFLNH